MRYRMCVERKHNLDGTLSRVILMCQGIDELATITDPRVSIARCLFRAKEWSKLEKSLGEKEIDEELKSRFCVLSHLEDWFDREKFDTFCGQNGIEYEYKKLVNVMVSPSCEDDVEEFLDYLVKCGIELPPGYIPANAYGKENIYWPLQINTYDSKAMEVIGITPCACYCSRNTLLRPPELYEFDL